MFKNGRQYTGEVLSQGDKKITFVAKRFGVEMKITRSLSEISEIVGDDTPTYCVIKITGPIGSRSDLSGGEESYVTAEAFTRALDEAKAAQPDYVLLMIQSPGGEISETNQIVKSISDARSLNFIAVVQSDHSAAAVIAMTCPTIYMTTGSSIGAAVPWRPSADGTPENIQEKQLSAVRAGFRNAAAIGGHSPLFIRGMSEIDIGIHLIERENEKVIIESSASVAGRVIKKPGEILTLTGREAVDSGLAVLQVNSLDAIRKDLGLESWQEVLPHIRNYIEEASKDEQRTLALAIQREKQRRAIIADQQRQEDQRQRNLDRLAPALAQIENRLAAVDAESIAAGDRIYRLESRRDRQLADLDREYRQLANEGRFSHEPRTYFACLDDEYNREYQYIMSSYEVDIAGAQERYEKAVLEAGALRENRQAIIEILEYK